MTPEDAEPRAADVLVLFGITGDLARKLVLPAPHRLVAGGELTVLGRRARAPPRGQGPADDTARCGRRPGLLDQQRERETGVGLHPQADLVRRQQSAGGAVVSFELKDDGTGPVRDAAWRVIDGCRLISITANLGDTRSTITHPATTTHGRVSPEARAAAGIGDGLLRVAVGLENPTDLRNDLARGIG